MMLVLDRDPSKSVVPGFAEIETQTVRLIDRIKVDMELQNRSFELFEKNVLYPFLKLLIKKFLSYFILKKLEEIANECSMLVTAEKISGSLNSLEKRLFKNNKLHQSHTRSPDEEIDLEAEMKKRFGFDCRAQRNGQTQKENHAGLFRKKAKNDEAAKKRNQTGIAEIKGGNRSSQFYNKFIKKGKQRRSEAGAKRPIEEATHKKPIKTNSRLRNGANLFGGNQREMEVPDFYRLNKLISQNSENVMELNQGKYERRLETLRRERLKNRKLPNPNKQRGAQRRLKRSFNYTKLIKRKKHLGDQNDENIINLKSRVDILLDFRKEMGDELKQDSQDPPASVEELKMIGIPNNDEQKIAANLKEMSNSNSFSKLGPNFESFLLEERENVVDSENVNRGEKLREEEQVKSEELKKSSVFLDVKVEEEGGLAEFMSKKKTKKKINDVVYEIGTDDWENNVFGKNTPSKDFLQKKPKPSVKT